MHLLRSLVASVQPFAGMQHLDVAGGTGDVAIRVLQAMQVCMALRIATGTHQRVMH